MNNLQSDLLDEHSLLLVSCLNGPLSIFLIIIVNFCIICTTRFFISTRANNEIQQTTEEEDKNTVNFHSPLHVRTFFESSLTKRIRMRRFHFLTDLPDYRRLSVNGATSVYEYLFTKLENMPPGGYGIYYGKQADFTRFKYMALLYGLNDGGSHTCGGAIIDELHILTAAHCLEDFEPGNMIVVAGRPHLDDPSAKTWTVEKIHMHPNFKANQNTSCISNFRSFLSCIFGYPDMSMLPENDIGVIKLAEALPLGERMTKVLLPESDWLPHCQELKYAGWGRTEYQTIPTHLQYTKMVIFDREECTQLYTPHRKTQFCAMTRNQASFIGMGDSGNPLVDENIVYGITSFIHLDIPTLPAGFTRVFSYIRFINSIITFGNSSSD